ncbi:hypothetical protein F5878DRAFT_527272 [Lentinula raphanica]|uniref:Retrotransposon gag domain-containing protein n=1 Tax=Lentinula raphanica TaxID=153919 RepID=A0AA38PIR3_9AGAR|nr:hypothetical protein F5878DRAFT_527272 [Lentinula raphanica]
MSETSAPPPRAATKGPAYMPAPGSPKAPDKFKGDGSVLRDFIEEFETCANDQELTGEEKVRAITKYVDSSTKKYWKTLEGYEFRNWDKLKDDLYDAYPGSKKGHRYNLKGLRKLAEKNGESRIEEEADLIDYARNFRVISKPLIADKKLTEVEADRYFWYGLHKRDRKAIMRRVELKDPDFDCTTVPDRELALRIGREVFSDDVLGMESDDPIADLVKKKDKKKKKKAKVVDSSSESSSESSDSSSSSDSEDEKSKKKRMPKQEVRTTVVEKPPVDSIEDLAKQLRALNVHDVNYAGVYATLVNRAPMVASAIAALPPMQQQQPQTMMAALPTMQMAPYPNRNQQPVTYPNTIPVQQNQFRGGPRNDQRPYTGPLPTDILCHFCKENHLIRNCPHCPEYMRQNRVAQIGRWFCWPDGHPRARQRIQADPTTGVKGTVDREEHGPQQGF